MGLLRMILARLRHLVDWVACSPWRSFFTLFVFNIAVRCYYLFQVPPAYILPRTDLEQGAIALSLTRSGQFANPYIVTTGPTAHLPPITPGILSLILRLFGITITAGYVHVWFTLICYALLFALLPWFADKFGVGRQAGFLGGLAGALVMAWPEHGEALTALVLGLLLVAFLHRWTTNRNSTTAGISKSSPFLLGIVFGVAFHLQPVLLLVLLGCLTFELWWYRGRRRWRHPALILLGVLLACIPWGYRNYVAFNELFFIRSNLGLELRMGNHDGAAATMEVMDARGEHPHPRSHIVEARLVQKIGEPEYMRAALAEALEWIRTNPLEFLRLTVARVLNLWFGPLHRPKAALGTLMLTVLAFLGAWRTLSEMKVPQQAALLIPLATYPLIYYVVSYMPRYRIPIDWILFMLASATVWRWISAPTKNAVVSG